jgi:hypothetical protein
MAFSEKFRSYVAKVTWLSEKNEWTSELVGEWCVDRDEYVSNNRNLADH